MFRSLGAFLKRHSLVIITLVIGILAGMILLGGSVAAIKWTSTESFCISCHSMEANAYAEYEGTIHDENRTGIRATCSDCHVPNDPIGMIVRKIQASREVYHHFVTGKIDTTEKYEEHRYEMAMREWQRMKRSDSQTCRSCHDESAMSEFDQSDKAWKEHTEAREKGQTCIDCHFGIAHFEPEGELGPQDIDINSEN